MDVMDKKPDIVYMNIHVMLVAAFPNIATEMVSIFPKLTPFSILA